MKENLDKLCSFLFSRFASSHVLLFVGQGLSDDDLRTLAEKVRWSAVITTIRDKGLLALFNSNGRTPWVCDSRVRLSGRTLSRVRPPIIQLVGDSSQEEEGDDFLRYGPRGRDKGNLANADDLIRAIPSLLDFTNCLVVAGLSSDEDARALDTLGPLLSTEFTAGSVSFWGMETSLIGKDEYKNWLKQISEVMSFGYFDTPLQDVIRYRDAREEANHSELDVPEADGDIFFCNHIPIKIGQDDVLRVRSVGTLLTERAVNRIRPLGRDMQRLWFSNFLELSGVDEPQWYGYLPQSDFYVKRDYENAFVQLVRRALRGQGIDGESLEDKPIILSGDPCSSKSVTLGALAYRVYNERISPVLFVSGGAFQSNSSESGYKRLDAPLQTIERACESGAPTLVVWDCSSYREIEVEAKRLLDWLRNRGRRVVLVCSSYSLGNEDLHTKRFAFDGQSESFEPAELASKAAVEVRSGCVLFKTSRAMSERERFFFWQKASSYSGVSSEQISHLRLELNKNGESDIFMHYYKLIALLRERLEQSLEGEQSKVTRFLQAEMSNYFTGVSKRRNDDRRSNPVWQAFLKAGMTEEQLNELYAPDEDGAAEGHEEDEWRESLVRANSYIAFFSRYKIDLPYSMVYPIVTSRGDGNPYVEDGRELFDVLTGKIPWLASGENEDEEFVFRFRNTLEADIFLERHGIGGEQLVDMMARMLDLYGEECQRNRYDDPRLASKLQTLMRLMGPNSKYYREGSPEHRGEHADILAHLDRLIQAVEKLLQEYRVPDKDHGFALMLVTLIREYYGRNVWSDIHRRRGAEIDYRAEGYTKESYELRLERINSASALALRSEELLEQRIGTIEDPQERGHLNRQANALIVEATRCSLEAGDLRSQYRDCCDELGVEPRTELLEEPQRYLVQFGKLERVIRNDPLNGYAYNAMFTLFEREYQNPSRSADERIEFLTEVMAVVEECKLLGDEIKDRGDRRNELDDHLVTISSFADGIPASIDAIEGRSVDNREATTFLGIYNRFLEEGNPAAILFVCRKEIKDILDSEETLSDSARRRCRRVLDFMREPSRFDCINTDANALSTLIRVAWMTFSGTQLSGTRECQTPTFSQEQWRELLKYCERYSQKAERGGQQPLVVLLYALAVIQSYGRTPASYERAYEILRQIGEDRFIGQYRLRTPFMVCDEDGEPSRYTGTVRYVKERYGFMDVNGLPSRFGNIDGVRFYFANLGRSGKVPERGDLYSDLEVGIGYTGFSLYKEDGRRDRRRFS